jgi:sortase (surface protein transpeptidase)
VIPAAAVAGAVLVAVGLATQQSAPQAPAAGSPHSPSAGSTATPHPSHSRSPTHSATPHPTRSASPHAAQHTSPATHRHTRKPAEHSPHHTAHKNKHISAASAPKRLQIPRIDVDTSVIKVGRTSNDQVGVPKGKHLNDAGWFDESPTPGQYGPSIIVGHIDSDKGPSVFYRLGELRHGNKITVTRKDHRKVTFVVDKARSYPNRNKLPAIQLYGGNVDRSSLRLITCTDFDHKTGHYLGNTIVYAHLTHTSK